MISKTATTPLQSHCTARYARAMPMSRFHYSSHPSTTLAASRAQHPVTLMARSDHHNEWKRSVYRTRTPLCTSRLLPLPRLCAGCSSQRCCLRNTCPRQFGFWARQIKRYTGCGKSHTLRLLPCSALKPVGTTLEHGRRRSDSTMAGMVRAAVHLTAIRHMSVAGGSILSGKVSIQQSIARQQANDSLLGFIPLSRYSTDCNSASNHIVH